MIDLEKLTNTGVRRAIQALQSGDKAAWLSCFSTDVTMTDDGSPRSFAKFSDQALGSERFLSIDKVDGAGLHLTGHFHSDQWGEFKTYFKFHTGADGKFDRLEVGQAP